MTTVRVETILLYLNLTDLVRLWKYALETFAEKRQTCYDFEPCTDHIIIENTEEMPPVWEIRAHYDPIPFIEHSETVVVPNSDIVKFCNRCNGSEMRTCLKCLGIKKNCSACNGTHFIKCEVCKNGKLKWFQSLKISWMTHLDQHFTRSSIPDDRLKTMDGIRVYEETGLRVSFFFVVFWVVCILTKIIIII